MKLIHPLVIGIFVVIATTVAVPAFAASQWAKQVGEILPGNITLSALEEKTDYLHIIGTAKSNTDISAFMRAIDQAKLGSVNLERIQREDGVSEFSLQIKR